MIGSSRNLAAFIPFLNIVFTVNKRVQATATMRLIPGTRIPQRIIHCWGWKPGNTEVLPPQLARYRATWQRLNPQAQHLLLTKWDFERDVLPLYPRLQRVYGAWPHWIQRVDMARFLAVYHYGGVYADTDATCLVPLQQWVQHHPPLQGAACVFARDTRRSPAILVPDSSHTMRPMSAQSGTFGAAQHHPLLMELLHAFQPRAQRQDEPFSRYVLNTTGPAWLTTTLAALWQHPAMVNGHVYVSREPIFGDTTPPQPGWLAAHHYTGLWRTPNKTAKPLTTAVAAAAPPSSLPPPSRAPTSTTPHVAQNPVLTPRVVLVVTLIIIAALLCVWSMTAVLWKKPRQGTAQGSRRVLAR